MDHIAPEAAVAARGLAQLSVAPSGERVGSDPQSVLRAFLDHLRYSLGKNPSNATPYDRFTALALAVRDHLANRWVTTQRVYYEKDVKRAYYLSAEYLLGRALSNNLLAVGKSAGVRHQVILSIVGVDQVPQLVYYRAKVLQEELLRQGPTPYSIVRATQFFEFMKPLMSLTSDDRAVRLPSIHLQPIASADVVDAVVEVSTGKPLQGIWNVAGPDVFSLDELGRVTLAAQHDKRTVITDDKAGMFATVSGDVLTASPGAHLAPTHYQDWIQTAR